MATANLAENFKSQLLDLEAAINIQVFLLHVMDAVNVFLCGNKGSISQTLNDGSVVKKRFAVIKPFILRSPIKAWVNKRIQIKSVVLIQHCNRARKTQQNSASQVGPDPMQCVWHGDVSCLMLELVECGLLFRTCWAHSFQSSRGVVEERPT